MNARARSWVRRWLVELLRVVAIAAAAVLAVGFLVALGIWGRRPP